MNNLPALLGGAVLVSAVTIGAAHLIKLETDQRDVLKQLQEIKTMLRARPTVAAQQAARPPAPDVVPANLSLSTRGAAAIGKADARLTLLEFSDFQCPFCGRYARETFDRIEHDYVDTGRIRYAFRHYPLESIHPRAFKAAAAAECANEQGKFWDLHKRLFANQQKLADEDLRANASAAGADLTAFDRCMAGPPAATLRRDMEEGARAGVSGTPFFFLGVTQKDGAVKVVSRLSGAKSFEDFKVAIDALLAGAPAAN